MWFYPYQKQVCGRIASPQIWLRSAAVGTLLGVLLCLAGCPTPGPPTENLGVLKTNASGNLVLFSGAKRGGLVTQTFLLYNDGRVPISIDSMRINGDSFSIFQVTPKINEPLSIPPGQANGVMFKIEFRPDSAGKFRASLAFTSPNVENVDDNGNFLVHLYGQVTDDGTNGTGLRFSCERKIDFGPRPKGVSTDQSCELSNVSSTDVELSNVNYKLLIGRQGEFRWLNPILPLTLKAGQRTTITIRFTPGSPKSEGWFILTTNPQVSQDDLRIEVMGTVSP